MDTVMYSWLAAAAIAPFVTILSVWTLVVFCSYRHRWRLVDLFFVAMTGHEVVYSLFAFGFSVLNIIRPILSAPCGFLVWGLAGTRSFHLSSITSLLLDRALSSKSPCKYRDSVRSSQVRYHVVVLGIIAIFIGVTAVFARAPSSIEQGVCSIHPLAWDVKFSMFLASVYGMLLLTGFVCFLILMLDSRERTDYQPKASVNEKMSPVPTLDSSGRSTSSSRSSNVYKNAWAKVTEIKRQTIASICCVSFFANHGPFLVMNVAGIVEPRYWSSWQDNITIWLSLSQGILIPFILLVSDLPFRSAVKNMLRQPGRIYRHLSDNSGFRLQVADTKCQKAGLSSSLMMMYPSSSCTSVNHNPFTVPHRLRWNPHTLPSLQSLTLDGHSTSPFQSPSDGDSICKSSSSRCSSPVPPIYRDILYSTYGGSCHSLLSRACSSSISHCDLENTQRQDVVVDDDTISITTDALDDFEFHGAEQQSARSTPHPHIKAIFDLPTLRRLGDHSSGCLTDKEDSGNTTDGSDATCSIGDTDSLKSSRGQRKGSTDRISCIFRPPSRSSRQDVFILNKHVFSFTPPSEPVSITSLDSLETPGCETCGETNASKLNINPCYANLRQIPIGMLQKFVPEDTDNTFVRNTLTDKNILYSEYL